MAQSNNAHRPYVLAAAALIVLGGTTAGARSTIFRDEPPTRPVTTTVGRSGPVNDALNPVEREAARKIAQQRAAWQAELNACAAKPLVTRPC